MKTNANHVSDERYFLSIKKFVFIACLVITANLPHHTLSLTVQLQKRNIDIAESMKQINLLKAQLRNLRKSVDEIHDQYYDQALQLASDVNVKEKFVRTCTTQTMRENYRVETARDYYRVKLTIPILDHLIEQIEFRFPSETCNVYSGFYIIPKNFLRCKGVDWKAEFMKFLFLLIKTICQVIKQFMLN